MNEVVKLIALTGLSQAKISRKLNIPRQRITEYKNGKHEITVSKLKLWCEKLEIDIKYLF